MPATKTRKPLTKAQQEKRERGKQYKAEVGAIANRAMDAAMHDPAAWRSALWTAAMHPQRPGVVNIATMAYQAPGQPVESYEGWQERGRQVRSNKQQREHFGENNMGTVKIFTAVRIKDEDEDDEARGEFAGFRVGTLYTWGRTEPIEGAESVPPGAPLASSAEQVTKAALALLAEAGAEVDEHADARALLGMLARSIYRDQIGAAVTVARTEGESAAHVAAVMLGIPSDSAPLPPMEYTADDRNPYGDVKATLRRVIGTGRQLAESIKNMV